MNIHLIRQNNIELSEKIAKNRKDVVETMSDLMESLDDSRPFCEDTEQTSNVLNNSDRVPTNYAMKLDVVNNVVETAGVVLDNDVSAMACDKKYDDSINGEIRNVIKEKSKQISSIPGFTTLKRNSSLASDLTNVIKYNPCDSAHWYVQSNYETPTKDELIRLQHHKFPANGTETTEDCPTRSASNTWLDAYQSNPNINQH